MPSTPGPPRDDAPSEDGPRSRRSSARALVSPLGLVWNRGRAIELMHRAMGFAALSLLTLVPLLIVVAAADLARGQGFARWLVQGLGVSDVSQEEVERLFGQPGQALQGTTAFGLAALAAFGVTFGSAVQTGYERVWDLPTARWRTMWRHVVWLAVLVGALLLFVGTPAPADSPALVTALVALSDLTGTFVFFWWSQRFLLCGRLRWRALAPGAVLTALGLLGLRIFSQLVFSPLIASNAVTYGQFGTVLVLQSWLVGVGFVVYGGALAGRFVHEVLTERRLTRAGEEDTRGGDHTIR
ncbi:MULTISPECIES: YhjD/YihY/BrkB family envelope integrity protein [unclassified Streptomyces]|uniref:YhjD/YihY/BrkB family envelope integrity protein n=1 Tax=unclassified Streptomyces TaxID=2593676 RepID=UPI001660A17B|nr:MULTISPECIES: YhjD/YihY/BrkB family envelope integrity protein [unclassified Streptomyces]MBD0708306.1 ribonuclease BN [Streptomyces sp. CBMA291]MBD0712662.1 ribonuclease BN [Streptomyces sp. CBMA370]